MEEYSMVVGWPEEDIHDRLNDNINAAKMILRSVKNEMDKIKMYPLAYKRIQNAIRDQKAICDVAIKTNHVALKVLETKEVEGGRGIICNSNCGKIVIALNHIIDPFAWEYDPVSNEPTGWIAWHIYYQSINKMYEGFMDDNICRIENEIDYDCVFDVLRNNEELGDKYSYPRMVLDDTWVVNDIFTSVCETEELKGKYTDMNNYMTLIQSAM